MTGLIRGRVANGTQVSLNLQTAEEEPRILPETGGGVGWGKDKCYERQAGRKQGHSDRTRGGVPREVEGRWSVEVEMERWTGERKAELEGRGRGAVARAEED